MSADWPPKIFRAVIQETGHSNIDMMKGMTLNIGGKESPMYSDDDIELACRFQNFGEFGIDLLFQCKDIIKTEAGAKLFKDMNDYFNGEDNLDKEVKEKLELWYNGEFTPGYYMDYNNSDFADWLKEYIRKEVN